MTYFPFVYLILLSPEQYYTNNLQIQNEYQPMPLDYAKKIDVRDKIQQPVVYLPYVLLSPLKNAALSEDSPKGNSATGNGAGAESEGNMDDDSNKENATLSSNSTARPYRGYSLILQHCQDGFTADENGNCLKGVSKGIKEFELERKKRAVTQQQNPKGRMIFKLSKKLSVRDKRFAEEKKLSYADVLKYRGRRPLPRPKKMPPEDAISSSPSLPTTTMKPNAFGRPAAPSLPARIPVPSGKTTDTPNRKPGDNPVTSEKPSTAPDNKSKPSAGKESSQFINSEAVKKPAVLSAAESPPKLGANQSETPNKPPSATSVPPYLYLVTTICENGYIKDANGNCIKTVKKKNPDKWSAKLERRRRDTDRIKLLQEIMDAEDRIVDKRNPQQRFYYRNDKKLENDTRKMETAFTSRSRTTLSTEKTPDKNAASDGFGYISKECNKLVPGLVSDGAGGCTKSVKPKEKILQLERRKRQARTAYINFIDPNNNLRKNNFTIRITLKGVRKEPYDDGNKAVADNGFGVTSSKCDNLVPGLVADGVGGCTKAVTTIRKKNKFSFTLKAVENAQPFVDVEYYNREPEPELVNSTDEVDPDADII